MVRLKHRLTEAPRPPERGVKAATVRLLLDTAMELIRQQGRVPSIAEVAVRSNVSRATTYRYFPSRSALVTAVVGASLGPVRAFASSEPDGRARVHELFAQTFPRFTESGPQRSSHSSSRRSSAPGCSTRSPTAAATASASSSTRSLRSSRRCRPLCTSGCTARFRSSTASSHTWS